MSCRNTTRKLEPPETHLTLWDAVSRLSGGSGAGFAFAAGLCATQAGKETLNRAGEPRLALFNSGYSRFQGLYVQANHSNFRLELTSEGSHVGL